MNIQVQTLPCIICDRTSILSVDEYGYTLWQGGMLIQKALPNMTVDEREMLMTGTHPDCWDTLTLEEED